MSQKFTIGQTVKFIAGSSQEPRIELCKITDIIKDDNGNDLYQLDDADYLYDFEIEPCDETI